MHLSVPFETVMLIVAQDCQKKGWSEGGHKGDCKVLSAVAQLYLGDRGWGSESAESEAEKERATLEQMWSKASMKAGE